MYNKFSVEIIIWMSLQIASKLNGVVKLKIESGPMGAWMEPPT